MDRSLWLLLRLRVVAWFRKRSRGLRTLKGVFLAVLGTLVFLPVLASFLFTPRILIAIQADLIRRHGPLGLFLYCVLNVLLSSGDRSVYYSPAEVNFLFSGPYRPRQLLIYKIVGGVGASIVTGLFMAFAFAHHASLFLSAFAGLTLTLLLIYLFSLAVGLTISTFGALAYSLGRRLLLAGLAALAFAAVWPIGRQALTLPFRVVLARILASPGVNLALLPFRPFVMAFAAETIWPDLAVWSALALAVDLALVGLVLGLNAGFLEASAAASRRVHRRQSSVKGRPGLLWGSSIATRIRVPMLPWLGGLGPNLWRQLTTACRAPSILFTLGASFLIPIVVMIVTAPEHRLPLTFEALAVMGVVAQPGLGFDFRSDYLRIGDLKTLPIRPTSLVLGQVLTPVVLLWVAQILSIAVLDRLEPESGPILGAAALLLLPFNFVLAAIDNLYFLWYPHRTTGLNSFDVQAIGRQLLLLTAKTVGLTLIGAVAAAFGALVYYFGGQNLGAAVVAAAVVMAGSGLALVPVVAQALEGFEAARDSTE